jgi:hydroxyacylglutathione hydrolase
LLPLGDHVIVYPAHGAGSVCGSGMASREFSTLGYERLHNPALKVADRSAFIIRKLSEHHYQPPYFRQMEKVNQEGPPLLPELPRPQPVEAGPFAEAMERGMIALDVRSPEAFAGGFIPNSLVIPASMLPSFAGWFLRYDRDIGLIAGCYADVETAVRHLVRLGYDRAVGFLDEGLHEWETSGRDYDSAPADHAKELKARLECGEAFTLLDVRSKEEFEQARLPKSRTSTSARFRRVSTRFPATGRSRPSAAAASERSSPLRS